MIREIFSYVVAYLVLVIFLPIIIVLGIAETLYNAFASVRLPFDLHDHL